MSQHRTQKTPLKPRLQIIRGLPGSGKTTLALKNFSHLMRIETDMFFSRGGKYVFRVKHPSLMLAFIPTLKGLGFPARVL